MTVLLLSLLFSCVSPSGLAESDTSNEESTEDYYSGRVIDYTTKIFDPNIQTLLLHSSASELEPPIIYLNGAEQIVLRFDDLSENTREMHYSFEHCTYDWNKSDLQSMDYVEGFNSDIIYDYDFSFNTLTNYTHYQIAFPNDRIKLTRSGNYIVKIYADGNEKDVLLTARFMIVEPLSSIEETIRPSSVVSERMQRQEIDLKVQLGGVRSANPYSEIELVLMQNFRWDNARSGVKPSFVNGNTLTFDYQRELTFDGTNEFRFVDAKSVRYRSARVEDVRLEDNGYHIILAPDERRAFKNYNFNNDINGRFLIKNDDMSDAHLESDYVYIHFSMPVDAMFGSGNMYIFGQLSQWNLTKDFRLDYNPETTAYEKVIMLKQGYYNYMYLWEYASAESATTEMTEGNHSEAENEYFALIYFKDRSSFADRLIGFKKFSNYKD